MHVPVPSARTLLAYCPGLLSKLWKAGRKPGGCYAEGVPGSNMAGNLVLAGRVKDTIVLSNGENVEPQPIEDACSQSDYIQFIVLYGQDRRALGALICKNEEAFEELEKTEGEASKLLMQWLGCISAVMRMCSQQCASLSWRLANDIGNTLAPAVGKNPVSLQPGYAGFLNNAADAIWKTGQIEKIWVSSARTRVLLAAQAG